jgi:hypothetical protein
MSTVRHQKVHLQWEKPQQTMLCAKAKTVLAQFRKERGPFIMASPIEK